MNSLAATAWPPQRTLDGASGSCEPKPAHAIFKTCLSAEPASAGKTGFCTAPVEVVGALVAAGALVLAGAGAVVLVGAGAAGAPHAASNPSTINMSITVLRLDISLL